MKLRQLKSFIKAKERLNFIEIAKILRFELDIAWTINGGADPINLIKKYPGGFPLWHIKDLDREHNTVLPLGQGVLDYKNYFGYSETSGLRYYFLEHERAADPHSSISASIVNIRKITQ